MIGILRTHTIGAAGSATGTPRTPGEGTTVPSRKPPEPRKAVLDSVALAAEEATKVAAALTDKTRENFRKNLNSKISALQAAVDQLDPVLRPTKLFNPLEPDTTARIVALMAASQPRHPLATLRPFYGAGVYALYYNGPFEPYAELSKKEHPLYVGKADPAKRSSSDPIDHGTRLFKRLGEHAASIHSTATLDIKDFDCRFLIVQSGFQHAAEVQLIDFFKPIWNKETKVCTGIGKHGDDPETRQNKRSPWDTLHPGRNWAKNSTQDQKDQQKIIDGIQAHLEQHPPISTLEELLENFITELRQIDEKEFSNNMGEPQEVDASPDAPTSSGELDHERNLLDLIEEGEFKTT
ncbi:restriction endonuclease [Amycolatopsis thailandensis]|uniref:Restriction endonuclease n=1 Tax=Amycolatopsis thailandensis TaxID=589330 RepID=A0A229RT49_9PSEU|nr:Eco29kI family restriction endonuclease [Amycolatopsis thailandensis]OXM49564.1 restriction endonuclease [Amycolatopsis thailandensis]